MWQGSVKRKYHGISLINTLEEKWKKHDADFCLFTINTYLNYQSSFFV